MGWWIGGKTLVTCSAMSTSVVTAMMKSTPAATAQMDFVIMACLLKGAPPLAPATRSRSRSEILYRSGLEDPDTPQFEVRSTVIPQSRHRVEGGALLIAGEVLDLLLADGRRRPQPEGIAGCRV